jgi:hypothetical protein
MKLRDGESIRNSIARLDKLDDTQLALSHEMIQAADGTMDGLDLLALGALVRSKAHTAGFRELLHRRNMICVGALLRF